MVKLIVIVEVDCVGENRRLFILIWIVINTNINYMQGTRG